MKKIIAIIFINILLLVGLFFLIDDMVYRSEQKKYIPINYICEKGYSFENPKIFSLDINDYGRGSNNTAQNPIVVFGGSFAYGQYLEENQTFEYKLSQILNRPVVNRAVMAGGISHMLFQTENKQFYQIIPYSDEVIYIMISDHLRRLLVDFFGIHLNYFNLRYVIKNNKITMCNYNNPYINFLKSLYIVKWFQHKLVYYSIYNKWNAEKFTDLQLLLFIKARENLEKNWKTKIKFTIFLYDECFFQDLLIQKLKANGFNVITTKEITDEDIQSDTYKFPGDGHPTEAAWNLLTPLIAEKLKSFD